ncbi:MAG: DUF971 domain-containing protein [Alphaproteobacteria bacterium]|nr:DUF971 domain-containing protein [Alphaproteobacteria bacterium]
MSDAASPWPLDIKFKKDERVLTISFEDGTKFKLPAEYLRVESPSAEVQGHGAATKITVAGKKNVSIAKIEQIGRYAVRLVFDDGHDTGLYSWDYLHTLGRDQTKRWFEYESRLKAAGLSREA